MVLVLSDVQQALLNLIDEVVDKDEASGYQMYPSEYREQAKKVVTDADSDDAAIRNLVEWSNWREWIFQRVIVELVGYALDGPIED